MNATSITTDKTGPSEGFWFIHSVTNGAYREIGTIPGDEMPLDCWGCDLYDVATERFDFDLEIAYWDCEPDCDHAEERGRILFMHKTEDRYMVFTWFKEDPLTYLSRFDKDPEFILCNEDDIDGATVTCEVYLIDHGAVADTEVIVFGHTYDFDHDCGGVLTWAPREGEWVGEAGLRLARECAMNGGGDLAIDNDVAWAPGWRTWVETGKLEG